MNFYYQNYAATKTSGISKKEWMDFGYDSLLKLFQFLQINTDKDLTILAKKFIYKEYSREEFLVKENEISDKLFFIISGNVRFFVIKEEREITKSLLNEGNLVTSISFLQQGKSDINIIACSKLRVLVLEVADLQFLMLNGWTNEISNMIIVAQTRGSVYAHQLSSILHLDGFEKIRQLKLLFPEIFINFSAKNIASLLSMQGSTYSKLYKQLT